MMIRPKYKPKNLVTIAGLMMLCNPILATGAEEHFKSIPEHKPNANTQVDLQQAARVKRLRKQERNRKHGKS